MNAEQLFVEAGKLLYREYSKYKKKPKKGGEKLKINKDKDNGNNKKGCCK